MASSNNTQADSTYPTIRDNIEGIYSVSGAVPGRCRWQPTGRWK